MNLTDLKSLFRIPPKPLLIAINETGVSVHSPVGQSGETQTSLVFQKGTHPTALQNALEQIGKRSHLCNRPLLLTFSGALAYTDVLSADSTDDRLDVTIENDRSGRSTLVDVGKVFSGSSLYAVRAFLDTVAIETAIATCREASMPVVGVDSLARFVLSHTMPESAKNRSYGIALPFEFMMIQPKENGRLNIVSDIHSPHDEKSKAISSTLAERCKISYTVEQVLRTQTLSLFKKLFRWSSGLSSVRPLAKLYTEARLRWNANRVVAHLLRYAAVFGLILIISGSFQLMSLDAATEVQPELTRLLETRQQLEQELQQANETLSRNGPTPSATAATLLGRLGQKLVWGTYLTEAGLSLSDNGEYVVTVKGNATSEARIFACLKNLCKTLPGCELSLESITESKSRTRQQPKNRKQFLITVRP